MASQSVPASAARRSRRRSRPFLFWGGWVLIGLGVLTSGFVAFMLWGSLLLGGRLSESALSETRAAIAAGHASTELSHQGFDFLGGGDDPTLEGLVPGTVIDPDPFHPTDIPAPPYAAPIPAETGQAFAVLTIPEIDLEVAVLEGVSAAELRLGVGHMPHTSLPGALGNAVLSGHRTTWGQPFNAIDTLSAGSLIHVETAWGTHTYEVTDQFIVRPSEIWVASHLEGAWLTLTSCHPKGSARQRIVTRARLVESPNLAFVNYAWGTDWPNFETTTPPA